MAVRWVTGFLDFPAPVFVAAAGFWRAVTGYQLSPPRGERGQFATLLPPDGDPCWRVQSVLENTGGVHLDLHVDDVVADAVRATQLGATVSFVEDGLQVLRSPGGLGICLSRWDGERQVPQPVSWPSSLSIRPTRSRADQVCIDIPPALYDDEVVFFGALTGFELRHSTLPEFLHVPRSAGQSIRFLLQRLTDPGERVRAHVDFACDDMKLESARHESLGAARVRTADGWTTLRDPAGLEYCITDRNPDTGR